MKKQFREYFPLSKEDLKTIWKDCIFVLDTNVLLDMYRYTINTKNDYMEVFRILGAKNRLFLPYQVGWEFFENRLNVLNTNKKSYGNICTSLRKELESIRKIKDHPMINLKDIEEKLQEIINDIQEMEKDHPDYNGGNDEILDEIIKIFDGKIGNKPTRDYFELTEKEGIERYKKKIPPGFEDEKKPSNKYGDYFVWKEIIEIGKKTKKPIIFITGDNKIDWWLRDEGKTIMPQPLLRKEIFESAKIDFHMYTPENFLNHISDANINEDISLNIDKTTIEEVKKVGDIGSRSITSNPKGIINNFINILQVLADETAFEIDNNERETILKFGINLPFIEKDEGIEGYDQLNDKISEAILYTNNILDKALA